MKKIGFVIFFFWLLFPATSYANYAFDFQVSEAIYVKPGETVNLPASIYNSGTETIVFRTIWNYDDSGKFVNQFNGVTIQPGQHFDFILGSIKVFSYAPIGTTRDDFQRFLGIGFADGTTLESYQTFSTRMTIANETYMSDKLLSSSGMPNMFGPGNTSYGGAWIGTAGLAHFEFNGVYLGTTQFAPDPNGVIPEIRNIAPVPAPATILLLGTGLIGLMGIRKKLKK